MIRTQKTPGHARPEVHEDDCLPKQSRANHNTLKVCFKPFADHRQLTEIAGGGYSEFVAAATVTRFGDRKTQRRTSAIRALFSCPSYGGVCWETFGSAGFLCGRFANPMHAATLKAIKVAVSQPTEETQP